VAHAERLADLAAQEPGGASQRRGGAVDLVRTAEHGVEDRGLLGVAADPNVGHGDEAEPRVLDAPFEHLATTTLIRSATLRTRWPLMAVPPR
jgi:hypothetical protein